MFCPMNIVNFQSLSHINGSLETGGFYQIMSILLFPGEWEKEVANRMVNLFFSLVF